MRLALIVAMDKERGIGKNNDLMWHLPADMKFFKATTIGNAVVMGRRTWETLKRPLKDRTNIVLSRERNFSPADSVLVMRDVDSVLEFGRGRAEHLFVMGGAKIYQAFLPHIDRWIVTEVPLSVEGADTFMPPNFLDDFEMYELRQLDEGLRVKFYERTAAVPPDVR